MKRTHILAVGLSVAVLVGGGAVAAASSSGRSDNGSTTTTGTTTDTTTTTTGTTTTTTTPTPRMHRRPIGGFGRGHGGGFGFGLGLGGGLGFAQMPGLGFFDTATTTALGDTAKAMQAAEKSGIAAGDAPDTIRDAVIAAAKTRLDQAVTDGALTKAQGDSVLAALTKIATNRAAIVDAAAGALKLSPADLVKQLAAGDSLPSIAKTQGVDLQDVFSAIQKAAGGTSAGGGFGFGGGFGGKGGAHPGFGFGHRGRGGFGPGGGTGPTPPTQTTQSG